MIIAIGFIVVIASVLGGFIMGGGSVAALIHPNELIIIAGGALGAMVVMAPKKVLMDLISGLITCLKGSPHSRAAYDELLKVLYELFLLGRRNGMIALEEHVMEPKNSPIFKKYPLFSSNHHAVEFLCGSLRPIIDGKIKPDQLRLLLDVEISRLEDDHHAPVNVLTKTGDAMPGFGIVAAVLGIVITMASISGPVEKIGEHVAAALVGTFLGILIAYGFISPLATNLEFIGAAELDYTRCIAACVTGFAGGMAPVTAVELGRRGLSGELRPTADEMEQMFKNLKVGK
ncbi:MAG TPA: flagellar motor stator protein MotA [Candidatus Polarisedimenticolia bacterium]|nr:flagellar motor stator protein MotA [Candidatus Polarisedimenticolia bacterium]